MDHPLADALRSVGVGKVEVASHLNVDPKTVERWIAGRTPYPRHQRALADLTRRNAADLWPDATRRRRSQHATAPVATSYPYRGAVPTDAWLRLFRGARAEIDLLAYASLFIVDEPKIQLALVNRAEAGVTVRVALGDPTGDRVRARGEEEWIGPEIEARVRAALATFGTLGRKRGIEVRTHNTTLYNSIYRADSEFLVNMHIFGMAAASAPVVRLHADRDPETASAYQASFERVWRAARRVTQHSV